MYEKTCLNIVTILDVEYLIEGYRTDIGRMNVISQCRSLDDYLTHERLNEREEKLEGK
jgi:hypothetical protein